MPKPIDNYIEESQIVAMINRSKFVDLKMAFETVQAYERFFARYRDKINWHVAARHLYLSPKIISRYSYKIDFYTLSFNKFLQEKTIVRYADKLNWDAISSLAFLSEDFIRKFQNKFYWYNISVYQVLSEKFIIEFKDKVDWSAICRNQKLSINFIRKYENYINFYQLTFNKHFDWTEDFIREFADKLSFDNLINKKLLTSKLLEEFHEKIYLPSAFRRIRVSSTFIKKCCLNMNLSFFPLCYFNINHPDAWKTFL